METKKRFYTTLASKQKEKITRKSIIDQAMMRKYGNNIIKLTQVVTITPIEVSPFTTLEVASTSKDTKIFSKIRKKI